MYTLLNLFIPLQVLCEYLYISFVTSLHEHTPYRYVYVQLHVHALCAYMYTVHTYVYINFVLDLDV